MDEFGHAPEKLGDAQAQFPWVAKKEKVHFTDVKVIPFRVNTVQSYKRNKGETVSLIPFVVVFRCDSYGEVVVILARIKGAVGKEAGFKRHVAVQFVGVCRGKAGHIDWQQKK
jgi:hypothetical protein